MTEDCREFVKAIGDVGLDTHITQLLGEVGVGRPVPDCVQPATVWLNDPWNASNSEAAGAPADATTGGPSAAVMWRNASRVPQRH